ncbi:MAG: Hsp20/alpha crystallin family protein [Chloroflexi bacterium]|nr:Hsp20/alpha crystallin family protein [Chloroflexota bacterium]
MTMVRWDPFGELRRHQGLVERLFGEPGLRPFRFADLVTAHDILVDMYQTKDAVVIKATIPGIKPEEVDISITGDLLTIKGELQEEREHKGADYFVQERHTGSFSRSLALPGALKTDKAEAVFDNGVLTLTIPKAEESKPKQIRVKAKGLLEGQKGKPK